MKWINLVLIVMLCVVLFFHDRGQDEINQLFADTFRSAYNVMDVATKELGQHIHPQYLIADKEDIGMIIDRDPNRPDVVRVEYLTKRDNLRR